MDDELRRERIADVLALQMLKSKRKLTREEEMVLYITKWVFFANDHILEMIIAWTEDMLSNRKRNREAGALNVGR